MGNPVVNAIADFTMGQVTAPRVPTPTVDSSRMDISYRQYPFGYGTSQETASASSYRVGDDDGGPRPYRGELNVKGIGLDVADRFVGAPRELSAAMAPVGFSTFMGIGSAMSYKNLTRIQDKQRAGEEGFAVGMLNGRIVGVSPGIGGSVLSGVLPEGLSHKQQQDIAQQLLEMSGPRPLETTPGLPGPTGDFPDRKTGITTPEAMFGVGQGGTSTPVGVSYDGPYPNYPTAPIPPAGDLGDETTSANIRFTNIGADRPDYSYMKPGVGYTTTGSPDYAYQGDPGPDTGLAPAGGATTPRDDQDDEKPAGKSYSINDPSRNPADRGYSMRAKGGPVQKTGFVEGSPDNYTKGETVADTVNTQVRENSFVLNAPTVETLQRAGMLPTGVDKSNKNTKIKANKGGLMPVALSKGEYVIEPEEAQRIGYSFLEQLNNQGKPEVDRRQAMGHGGMTGTTEEIEAALTGTPTPAPTNFQNIILQDGPVELEYRHGESEFDGSYPSLDERDIEDELSPEAQAVLRNNPGLQTQLFTDMGPRIAQDNRNFMTTAQSMTAYDHMRQFERRGLGKLFPGATADEIMALTANPDITISDSKKSIASGDYQGKDDAVTIYPHTIDLVNRLKYGYKGSAIGTKASGIDLFNVNDPIEKIYGSTVDSVTYHELLHMSYAKKMRRNLPFKHTVILEEYTNMGFLGGDERNWTPSDVLKERADIEAQLSKSSGLRKGKNREALLQRQEELNELIKGYKPDQNHSAMMYYEIERIMDETNDFPIDKRVVARQYIASKSMQYIPDSKQSEIMRMRMQILRRPENKKLLAALRKEDDFVMESKYFLVKPEFYAKFAVQNPELLPALDRFTNEFLTTTRRIHAHYSDEFRAALNANDVYDLPIGSTIRKSAIDNLQEVNSVKRYPDYWGNKDRMYKIPPQMDLIQPRTYDPTKRDMVVPNEALQQFIFKSNSFMDSSATR